MNDKLLDDTVEWYKRMYDDNPDSYQIMMGYANALSNQANFDDAIELYLKVATLQPQLATPHVYMAYIYEYKRIEPKKSL